MKPAILNKMEKSEGTSHQVQVVHDKSSSRYLLYAICGLILGLVAGIFVLSMMIYGNTKDIQRLHAPGNGLNGHEFSALSNPKFGRFHKLLDRVTKDVTFHIARTGETITENIVITDKEEVIVTPRATFIFDYSNGWLVTKFSEAGTNACYISEFRMTGTIENQRESLVSIKDDVTIKEDNVIHTQYQSTNRVVDAAMLSPASATSCRQSRLVWFTEVSNRLAKRSTSGSYTVDLPDGRRQTVTYL